MDTRTREERADDEAVPFWLELVSVLFLLAMYWGFQQEFAHEHRPPSSVSAHQAPVRLTPMRDTASPP